MKARRLAAPEGRWGAQGIEAGGRARKLDPESLL